MSQRPLQYSVRGMLIVMTATAAICALLVRMPGLAAALGSLVAGFSIRIPPDLLFPEGSWILHRRSDRVLKLLTPTVGVLLTIWAMLEMAKPPGERGMALLAAVLGGIMLALAAAIYGLGRRGDG